MTLKYAHMGKLIPPLSQNTLIDEIVAMQIEWQKEISAKYPNLMRRVCTGDDELGGGGFTSFAIYLRAEF